MFIPIQGSRRGALPLSLLRDSSAYPSVPGEPVLNIGNIQGNIVEGFKKEHQHFIYLQISPEAEALQRFKAWLGGFTPFIATAEEVISFNRLFKALVVRRGIETRAVRATWTNIAFSFSALVRLSEDAEAFTDYAFRQGLASRSSHLADPTDPNHRGHPNQWVVGGPTRPADAVIVIASDDPSDLAAAVQSVKEGAQPANGWTICYEEAAGALRGAHAGTEHFGFRDGISQPGIRGRLSSDPTDLLTPRQNPANPNQGRPGQDLIWPGEFLFGYPKQKMDIANPDDINPGPDSLNDGSAPAGPAWARDGSYLVIRRLTQDVAAFHEFIAKSAQTTGARPEDIEALICGRWSSGAPILRSPHADNSALGGDASANNDFRYATATPPAGGGGHVQLGSGALADPDGKVCPMAAHIRKAYPRDDVGQALAPGTVQRHRILRRGVPFGKPFDEDPQGERGLIFACYQTSIVDQFEFIQTKWLNSDSFNARASGPRLPGHDMIAGQNSEPGRVRRIRVWWNGREYELVADKEWVTPTGGGYFFSPSIEGLNKLANG